MRHHKRSNYFRYWGKAKKRPLESGREILIWHPLALHLLDAGAVARQLCKTNPRLLLQWKDYLGLKEEELLDLISFFAAIHDLGKFAADFQYKIPELASLLLEMEDPGVSGGAHSISAWMLLARLQEGDFLKNIGVPKDSLLENIIHTGRCPEALFSAAFGHHGVPTFSEHEKLLARQLFSDADCLAAWTMLMDFQGIFSNTKSAWSKIEGQQKQLRIFSWPLSGLITLSDWLASSYNNFPYLCEKEKFRDCQFATEAQASSNFQQRNDTNSKLGSLLAKEPPVAISKDERISLLSIYFANSCKKAKSILKKQGLESAPLRKFQNPWSELFGAAKQHFTPRPLQNLVNKIQIYSSPTLYIIEDATGSGKTEAALILAARLMEKGKASGFYFALPSMATSNGMYFRLANIYQTFFTEKASLVLAHSARKLHAEFQKSIRSFFCEPLQSSLDEEFAGLEQLRIGGQSNSAAACSEWISDQARKAFLAQVGVGSIDQALIAVLYSRFNSLRLFGLSQKILILDEVHAYDAYMQAIIGNLLFFQASQGQSVILLSATLPLFLKRKLAEAYRDGLALAFAKKTQKITRKTLGLPTEEEGSEEKTQDPFSGEEHQNYPLLTCVGINDEGMAKSQEPNFYVRAWKIPAAISQKPSVKLSFFEEEAAAAAFLKKSCKNGQCAVWIRNTVADAQRSYAEFLQMGFSEENLHIFHSRFMMEDRQRIENEMLARFGKESQAKERSGQLLIATQVVEQSLDLDFDVMVTDLCPIDLIMQRAGRLHRHSRDAKGTPVSGKDKRGQACLYVLGPYPGKDADAKWYSGFFPKGALVYPHHGLLWKTSRLLHQKKELRLPEMARELIEEVYGIMNKNPKVAWDGLPLGLQACERQAQIGDKAKSAKAQNSLLSISEGYVRFRDISPWEERQAPTRYVEDGQDSVEFCLCIEEEGGTELRPLARDPKNPWAMSEVRWNKKFAEALDYSSEMQEKIKATKKKFSSHLRWVELLPMQKKEGVGFCSLGAYNNRHLIYSRTLGLFWEEKQGLGPTEVGNG